MANPNQSEKSNALDREENITRGNLSAKRVVNYAYDSSTDTLQPAAPNLTPGTDYDYIDVQQTDSRPQDNCTRIRRTSRPRDP